MKGKFIDMDSPGIMPNVDDPSSYIPEDPEVFAFGLHFLAGADGEEGHDAFEVFVVSPKWLLFNSEKDILMGRHMLIMRKYDYEAMRSFIVSYVESCTGETWKEVAEKIGRLGKWEFEDYQEPAP
jgi:hypothetical protein